MNRKDIALSVGGTLASMALAYLLWRIQQKDAAQAAANASATATQQAATAAQDQANEYAVSSALPSLGVSSTSGYSVSTPVTAGDDVMSSELSDSETGLLGSVLGLIQQGMTANTTASTPGASSSIAALTGATASNVSAAATPDYSTYTTVTGLSGASTSVPVSSATSKVASLLPGLSNMHIVSTKAAS